jgi:ribulose-5-phosphate 4-epimerase/fuculose-1-phosphate aldolase
MSPSSTEPQPTTTPHDARSDIFNKKGADQRAMAVGASAKSASTLSMPTFSTKEEEQKYQKEHLACAFRVFAAEGFSEGLAGHMSLRDPINPKTFWINPYTIHFEDITVSDLVQVTEDAEVISGDHAINAAGFAIHSEIHKAHPWINAVCHAHSIAGKAYSAFGIPLPPLFQDSLRFYGSHEVLTEYGGVTLSTDEGKMIADIIKPNTKVAILQHHGLLSVGTTIDEACYWFCCFDRCCRAQVSDFLLALVLQDQYARPFADYMPKLMIDAASPAHGGRPKNVDHETAYFTEQSIGSRYRAWLNFQPYYTNMLKKTKGDFLK